MADVKVGALKWEADVDTSKLESGFKRIEELAKQAAKTFAKSFAEGSDSAGDAITNAFDGINSAMDATVNRVAAKAGPWGAAFAAAWNLGLGDIIKDKIEPLVKATAGWFSDLVTSAKAAGDGMFDAFAKVELGGVKLAGVASSMQDSFDTFADDVIEALDRVAGRLDEVTDAGQKATDQITAKIKAAQLQIDIIGKSAGEAARLMSEATNAALYRTGSAADTRALAEQNAALEKWVDLNADRRADLQQNEQWEAEAERAAKERIRTIEAITQSLQRQGQMQLANADAINKTAYALALERAQAQAQGTGRKAGVADNPAVLAAQEEYASNSQIAANKGFNADLEQQIKLQTAAYQLHTASLGADAGETERLKFRQTELTKAQMAHVVVTDELREKIELQAAALGDAAQKAALAADTFKELQQVGTTVASSIESAFSKWITGSQFKWHQFITGMMDDLAKLALKAALMPIFGGNSSSGGGLISDLIKSILPGRASGGPVSDGSPYIVGEQGPELFVPRSGGGTIVPNNVLGGSGPQHINMTLNLAGANGDETIARIARQYAMIGAQQAIAASSDQFPMRQRRLEMLGA